MTVTIFLIIKNLVISCTIKVTELLIGLTETFLKYII